MPQLRLIRGSNGNKNTIICTQHIVQACGNLLHHMQAAMQLYCTLQCFLRTAEPLQHNEKNIFNEFALLSDAMRGCRYRREASAVLDADGHMAAFTQLVTSRRSIPHRPFHSSCLSRLNKTSKNGAGEQQRVLVPSIRPRPAVSFLLDPDAACCCTQTYIMIKPDGVQRNLVGEIIKRFEAR